MILLIDNPSGYIKPLHVNEFSTTEKTISLEFANKLKYTFSRELVTSIALMHVYVIIRFDTLNNAESTYFKLKQTEVVGKDASEQQ